MTIHTTNASLMDAVNRRHCIVPKYGLPSYCTAHDGVLASLLAGSRSGDGPVLIEATSNQVNHRGGYTGMSPQDFAEHIRCLAAAAGVAEERLLLGGDHLGVHPWRKLPALAAMEEAKQMVAAYVRAGFGKIHIDCSAACADDPQPLPDATQAARAAVLCAVAEAAGADREDSELPRYVIGTEVPTPGGDGAGESEMRPTTVASAETTIAIMNEAFVSARLERAWERIIAMVVQPGVEFGNSTVHPFDPQAALPLAQLATRLPWLWEAHSTDYQSGAALAGLVSQHFVFLKVGPELTFAWRQVLLGLAAVETCLLPEAEQSRLVEVIEKVMQQQPEHWQEHYDARNAWLKLYSYSDRVRYYWNVPSLKQAVHTLLVNLASRAIPFCLLSQFLPQETEELAVNTRNDIVHAMLPQRLLACAVDQVRRRYDLACGRQIAEYVMP